MISNFNNNHSRKNEYSLETIVGSRFFQVDIKKFPITEPSPFINKTTEQEN